MTQKPADAKILTGARYLVAIFTVASLVATACGSEESQTAEDTEASAVASDGMDESSGMGAMQMNMGDPSATPAEDVEGAALARGDFEVLDTRPAGYDNVQGSTVIARSPAGTTVTVRLSGLLPNVEFISHLHEQACDDDNAGDHYQFDKGGATTPPNEIHLAFTSDDEGNGFMTAENMQVAGEEAVAFVVHPADLIDNKIACADLVADDAAAVAAAIASGAMHTGDDQMGSDEMDESEMDESEMDESE